MKNYAMLLIFLLTMKGNMSAQQWLWMTPLPDSSGYRSGMISNVNGDLIMRQTNHTSGGATYYTTITDVSETGVLKWMKRMN